MKKQIRFVLAAAMLWATACVAAENGSADIYDGWKPAVQAWSFNRFTLFEAIDKAGEAGMHYIEAFPTQAITAGAPGGPLHLADADQLAALQQKLQEKGIKLVSYGVVGLPNDEAQCRQVFDFAKKMGIETIVSEPPEDAFEMIDGLCQEYKIKVAVHNHPRPSHYWNPDTVLRACEGRSKYIGACGDTGHWMRSGIDPLDAIKKLKSRMISVHLKDLSEFADKDAHDVVWGTGLANIRGILAELDRQGFKGIFSAEYEYNWDDNVGDIKRCREYFDRVAAELSGAGWKPVFEKDLSNAVMKEGSWVYDEKGVLSPATGLEGWDKDIWTKERYGNFVLAVEFKVPEGGNSGVFLRTGSIENWINTAIEVQIHSITDGTKHGQCGAIYDCLSPSKAAVKKPGEWNRYFITCLNNKIYVNLNGSDIIDMDLDEWTEAGKNPQGTDNKFSTAYKDMPREGHLGFQFHGNPIWFRDIMVKSFD